MKRTDINHILVIGSGPIVIGQACEFDYSGVQAVRALKEEGYEVSLINPNPATVMTTPGLADHIFMEPLRPEYIEKIFEQAAPDAILSTMGGQTALNLTIELEKLGLLEKYGVKYGDMLFCRSSLVAEGIGKASIVPQGASTQILFECHVIRLPLDLRKCVPEFVQVLSTTNFFRQQIIAQSKTATMTTIGQDGILKAMITLPPIELQNQFAAFVKQTDKSKLAIQKNLEKLEILRKSLMQKYFD